MKNSRSILKQVHGFLIAALIAATSVARAQDEMSVPDAIDCPAVEPDSVQVSWRAPSDDGSWLFEPDVGCRMWDWHPDPSDGVTWSGQCRDGAMAGWGVAQWFEHGQPLIG